MAAVGDNSVIYYDVIRESTTGSKPTLLTTELLHILFKVWNIFSAFRHLSVKGIIITPQKMLIVPNRKIEQASIGEQ